MPKGSSPARLEAIKHLGADAYITDLNYDDTVQMAADLSEKHHWILVQDTAWEGYQQIPLYHARIYNNYCRNIQTK